MIRRLNAAAGADSPNGEILGLAIAVVVCCAFGGSLVAFYLSGGAPSAVDGAVIGQHLAETDYGTRLFARVQVDDRQPLVALPPGMVCRPGDRIALNRRKAVLGFRYTVRPEGCRSME